MLYLIAAGYWHLSFILKHKIKLKSIGLAVPGYLESAFITAKQHSIYELWQDCHLSKVKAGKRVVALGAIRAATEENFY